MSETMYERIKRLRKERRMTQSDLAERTGYADKSMIARIESGSVVLSEKKIPIFAKALGVSSIYLFIGDSEDGPPTDVFTSPTAADIALSSEEEELVIRYRAADEGIRSSVRKLLDLPGEFATGASAG